MSTEVEGMGKIALYNSIRVPDAAPDVAPVATPKRVAVDFRYDALNHDFIKDMARIAAYAGTKYGSPEQYATGRLEGEKSPINHIYEHLRCFQVGEPHDHFEDVRSHLVAVAYNAMMEYLYVTRFGYKGSPLQEIGK